MKESQQGLQNITIHNLWLKRGDSQLFQDFLIALKLKR